MNRTKTTANNLPFHLLALLVVAIWGVTFVSTKVLIGAGLLPSQIFFIRFVLAYTGIWFLCLSAKENKRLFCDNAVDELLMLFLGISGGSFYFLTENSALACTQACNVSFIVCSAPLITTLLTLIARKVLRGRLAEGLEQVEVSLPLVLGTMLALTGMALLIFEGVHFSFSLKGDLLSLGAAVCWACYSIFMSQMTLKYGALMATRKVFFYGLVTILPFLFNHSFDFSVLLRPEVYLNLLFLGLIASLACFVLWNLVMSRIGNVTSTNYVYLNPFFTLVSASLLLGERMTPMAAVGSVTIFAGVFLAGRKNNYIWKKSKTKYGKQ